MLSPEVKYVTDWKGYKDAMFNKYGIQWSDDVTANGMKFNLKTQEVPHFLSGGMKC